MADAKKNPVPVAKFKPAAKKTAPKVAKKELNDGLSKPAAKKTTKPTRPVLPTKK